MAEGALMWVPESVEMVKKHNATMMRRGRVLAGCPNKNDLKQVNEVSLKAMQVAVDFLTLSLGYGEDDWQVRNLRGAIAVAKGER